MAEHARRPATYRDLLDLPDNVVGEIVAGELYVSPRPRPRHANVSSTMGADLNGPFHRRSDGEGGPGGWWILDEPELHLGEDVLVSDLAGWRRERLPKLPEQVGFELPPDWVCEVHSPSTRRLDRLKKRDVYVREKVPWVWFVEPEAPYLEVFRYVECTHQLVGTWDGGEPARVPPFDAVELDLARWWASE